MKNKPKFISDLMREEIALGYKITIIEALRNVGKTTGALNFFDENVFSKYENDRPHILGLFRNSTSELDAAMFQIATYKEWKYVKLAGVIIDGNKNIRVRGMSFTAQTGQKSTIEVNNEKESLVCNWIWWDEYCDTRKIISNMWHQFHEKMISLSRNNPNIRVLATGNADNANNPILLEFGIDTDDIQNKRIITCDEDIYGNDISHLKIMRFHRFLKDDFDMTERENSIGNLLGKISYASENWESGNYINQNSKQLLPLKHFIKGNFEVEKVFIMSNSKYLLGQFEYENKKVFGVISAFGHEWDESQIPVLAFDGESFVNDKKSIELKREEIKNVARKLGRFIKQKKLFSNSYDFMQILYSILNIYGLNDENVLSF